MPGVGLSYRTRAGRGALPGCVHAHVHTTDYIRGVNEQVDGLSGADLRAALDEIRQSLLNTGSYP